MITYSSSSVRTWSRLGPGGTMGVAALELPAVNDRVVFLSADMSTVSGLDRFKTAFPERHYNLGIAEQNMVGVAAGMASEGMAPFLVTYSTFFAMRALDQIKVNMGYMRFPIRLVGNFAGFSAGILGPTHMSLEDVAAIRSIPNITVVSPADCTETVKVMLAAAEHDGPLYIRLTGTPGMPVVYSTDYDFRIGQSIRLREGAEVAILATGSMVHPSLKAAELLEQDGISCSVTNMHTIKPLDTEVLNQLDGFDLVVTVEEHSILGGLGGAVAEHLASEGCRTRLLRIGAPDSYPHAGEYQHLLAQCGLTAEQIGARISSLLSGVRV